MKKIVWIIIACCLVFVSNAQDVESEKSVELTSSYSETTVKLRWAPTHPEYWQMGRDNGYIIEKYTLAENGNKLPTPKYEMITGAPVMHIPIEVWKERILDNDMSAVIAQAFWGEAFDIDRGSANTKKEILDGIIDTRRRYIFSLLAADFNFEAAQMAGWGYEDYDVLPGGKYKYVIRLNDPTQSITDSSVVVVDMDKPYKLPLVRGVYADFDDRSVQITWNDKLTEEYTSYIVERSEDNKNFQRINNTALVGSFGEENTHAAMVDSIPNDVTFYYRVRGVDCFGDVGPPSRVVEGEAFRKMTAMPSIIDYKILNYDVVEIEWTFDKEQEDLLSGFEILYSNKPKSDFKKISDLINPKLRKFACPAENSNYFIVRAISKHNELSMAPPYYVQRPDNVPPEPPAQPVGYIDSVGVVHLAWDSNKEEDLDGYYVTRRLPTDSMFLEINVRPVKDTSFVDTITLKTDFEYIEYAILAVDETFNHSNLSVPAKLKIPDVIPPSPALLRGATTIADGTVKVEWLCSNSPDVEIQVLYRKKPGDENWTAIQRFNDDSTNVYIDKNLDEGQSYYYTILVVDNDRLESEPAKPVSASVSVYKRPADIEKLSIKMSREKKEVSLKWKKQKDIKCYQIYRKIDDDGKLRFLVALEPDDANYKDTDIEPFHAYNYYVRSIGLNRLESPFKEAVVKW
jgi:fibronectin type 3 domain-containing protein